MNLPSPRTSVTPLEQALQLVARRRTELAIPAHTAGWTYQRRLRHIASMLVVVADSGEPPTMDQATAVCAHALELALVVDRDEMLNPAAGEAA